MTERLTFHFHFGSQNTLGIIWCLDHLKVCPLASVPLPQDNKLPKEQDCAPFLVALPTTYIEPHLDQLYIAIISRKTSCTQFCVNYSFK